MITIQKITYEEVPQAKELLSITWSDTYGSYLSPKTVKQVTTTWHTIDNLAKQAKDKDTYFAIAKNEESRIIGLTTARKLDDKKVYISRIYVNPSEQGHGIGKKLLIAIFDYFPNIQLYQLEVEKLNKHAILFYKKQGFKIVGEKIEEVSSEKLETFIMEKV